MPINAEFQRRFVEYCAGEDCTNIELTTKIGIDANILYKGLNYGIVPKPHVLIRIADYFDVSIDYLLGRMNIDNFQKSAETKISFYDRLEELKGSQTYYALGKATLIDSNYFSNWKTKKYLPSLEYLISLANYFETTIDYLLGRTDIK